MTERVIPITDGRRMKPLPGEWASGSPARSGDDSLGEAVFRRMNDADFPVAEVLNGIDAASAAGLAPIKINMVVKRGANEDSVLPMARYFKGSGHIVRFIEFMDVGATNGWRMDDVLPSADI